MIANNRIQEIALSSGIYDSLSDPFDIHKTGNYYGSVMVDLEKFAELIIRECALTAGLMEFENRKNIGAAILDRFGVSDENCSM